MNDAISLEEYKCLRKSSFPKKNYKLQNQLRDSLFLAQLKKFNIPEPELEFRFHEIRKWRFDFAWKFPTLLAVEIEGGSWIQGRHTRGKGFEADLEKYNSASLDGWRILRVTPKMIENGSAAQLVKEMLQTLS